MRLWSYLVRQVNDATTTYKIHACLALAWILAIIPAWYLLRNSLFFVIAVSVYANFVSHWGAWQAVRAELVAGRAEAEAEVVAAMFAAQNQEMLERIIAAVVPVVNDAVSGVVNDAVSVHRAIVDLLAVDGAISTVVNGGLMTRGPGDEPK